jgi:hypothetical protein
VVPAKRQESMSTPVSRSKTIDHKYFGKLETSKISNQFAPQVTKGDGETRVSQFETENSNETLSDTASTLSADNETPCGRMLLALQLSPIHEKLVFDAQGGLTGNKIVASFSCILDGEKFFVHLADTEYSLFDKNTLFNLANVAENKGAKDFYILLYSSHP